MKTFSEDDAEEEFYKRQKNFKKKDADKIFDKEENLFKKFLNISNLKEYYQDFKDLFSLLKDYYKGNYQEVPWLIIASIGGTLLYVLSPIDLIPDFIPFFGYLDDAVVFGLCLKVVKVDLEKYRMWRNSKDTNYGDEETETVGI